jgi:hypothetical protein
MLISPCIVNQFLKMFQHTDILSLTTRCCNYSLFELLMVGECFTRNMYSRLQGIKYCTKKSAILLEHF